MKNSKIVAVHLLNDFSGSPFVLRQSLEALLKEGYEVELFTATPSGKGFLSDIEGVQEHPVFYRWSSNRWVTLLFFLWSQATLFFRLLFYVNKRDIVYINSLLPFGAALAARLRGCKVLYHVHEVSIRPALLKYFLLKLAGLTSSRAIFVSRDLLSRTSFSKPAAVVYNALPVDFIKQAMQCNARSNERFTVLMLCSLKRYKGVLQFVECARRLPSYDFKLVLNASAEDIKTFFENGQLPSNLQLFPAQGNVHAFYRDASVVMNMSLPAEWIETFGMTILEAMYYKRPVIVPYVGGVTELVTDGAEGYRVDPNDVNKVCDHIQLMATCPSLYNKLSLQAYKKAQEFTPNTFSRGILDSIASLDDPNGFQTRVPALQLSLF